MKNIFLIIILFNCLVNMNLNGQTNIYETCNLKSLVDIKINRGCKSALSNKNLVPENEYPLILKNILESSGLSANFPIYRCDNLKNAAATAKVHYRIENDLEVFDYVERYFLLDFEWINKIGAKKDKWVAYGIMAHEIGHMANNHHFRQDNSFRTNRIEELEADYFAGFTLYKLGATLEEALAFINVLPRIEEDLYKTHPSTEKRLKEVAKGYNKATLQEPNINPSPNSKNIPNETNNIPKYSSEDCEIKSIGDFCFTNNSKITIGINIGDRESRPDRYVNRAYTVKDITLEPGETQCFYDYKAKAYKFSVFEGGTTLKTGNIRIEKCQSKNLEIGKLSKRNTSVPWYKW